MLKKCILYISSVLALSPCYATNYALTIGISEYPVNPLEGPTNDISAINQVLKNKWDFDDKNLVTLLNQQATKKNILEALNNLYHRSQPGDNVWSAS